jgi:thiol-disulfide isomerase/thioredoxin
MSGSEGQAVRVVACLMLAACVCVAPSGCASSSKRGAAASAQASLDKPAAKQEPVGDPLISQTSAPAYTGMLAGRVIDVTTNRPIEAYVRWECLDETKKEDAPIDVAARDGFFAIEGLKPGKHYKLVARAKQGERMLAGTSYVTTPNVTVVIKLSERFVTPDTPPLPGPPNPAKDKADAPPKDAKKTAAAERPGDASVPGIGQVTIPQRDDSQQYVRPIQPKGPADEPRQGKQPSWTPAQTQQAGGFLPNVVTGPEARAKDPAVRINPGVGDPAQQKPLPPSPAIPMGTVPVPSCNLVGDHLNNLALPDLNGDTWEWRKDRRGKLVLLDFWFANCVYCKQDIPNLRSLQGKYGYAGLEVVGIACEEKGTTAEQVYRASVVCQRLQTNYRLLLAGGPHNPVPTQFSIRSFPTLVLLNEAGNIVWRHEGQLRDNDLRVLEREIENGLGMGR